MKKREVSQLEFVKFRTIGQAAAGKIIGYGKNDNGPFVEIAPVLLRDNNGKGAKWTRYGGCAVGLTTNLRRQIKDTDVGKLVFIEYVSTKPSDSGSPQKIFDVFDAEVDDLKAFAKSATASDGPINPPTTGGRDNAPFPGDDDDMPF